jgi:hypothetical protein
MADRARHDARVQREFTRQAESFAASRLLGEGALTRAIAESLGESPPAASSTSRRDPAWWRARSPAPPAR